MKLYGTLRVELRPRLTWKMANCVSQVLACFAEQVSRLCIHRGRVQNGLHVSIVWPGDDAMVLQDIPWPGPLPESFNGCFNEVAGAEGAQQ